MAVVEIRDDIHWVGVNDRTTDLFEGLWPISREGVSYNSYLVRDKKTALIDLSKAIKTDDFFDAIAEIADLGSIDYVVINHMEPDHTGVLRTLRRMSPRMEILCTSKARVMLEKYYGMTEHIREVADGERLSLGDKSLVFYHAPFVHWPETMVTFEERSKVLFTCDAFGGYGAFQGAIFDDQCDKLDFYVQESLRYYVNIVAKFSKPVLNAIQKISAVPYEIIAPSHGLVWRKDPAKIVELYRHWSSIGQGEPADKAVTLLYGSMYGNTEQVMNAVAKGIRSANVGVEIFDVARTHSSYILPHLWTKRGVMIGAPTYEGGLFPPMCEVLRMAEVKRVTGRKAAWFGSYGWSGGAQRELKPLLEAVKWELSDTLEFQGGPHPQVILQAEAFGRRFAESL